MPNEEAQRQCSWLRPKFVARLISEGKDASAANATLYELSKALSEIPRKTKASSAAH